jgi:hypothetical protein
MANTVQDNNRIAWTYTDDDENDYRVSAKAVYVGGAEAAKWGGSAAAASVPQLPKGFRMRKRKVVSGAVIRWVPCYKTDATLWTGVATTVLLNKNGVDAAFDVSSKKLSERNIRDGTTQSA